MSGARTPGAWQCSGSTSSPTLGEFWGDELAIAAAKDLEFRLGIKVEDLGRRGSKWSRNESATLRSGCSSALSGLLWRLVSLSSYLPSLRARAVLGAVQSSSHAEHDCLGRFPATLAIGLVLLCL
jgi:hypothetical protein